MSRIATWRGPDPWRVYRTGERHDDGGDGVSWSCTCPRGRDHQVKREDGSTPHPCKHLSALWETAKEGNLSGKFDYTEAGYEAADNCHCNGGKEGIRLNRLPKEDMRPKNPPKPGEPSRNKPCPCGSDDIYKWCHGRPEGPPAGAPKWGGVDPERKKKDERNVRARERRKTAKEAERERPIQKAEKTEARRARVRAPLENARAKDEVRRVKQAARDKGRKR